MGWQSWRISEGVSPGPHPQPCPEMLSPPSSLVETAVSSQKAQDLNKKLWGFLIPIFTSLGGKLLWRCLRKAARELKGCARSFGGSEHHPAATSRAHPSPPRQQQAGGPYPSPGVPKELSPRSWGHLGTGARCLRVLAVRVAVAVGCCAWRARSVTRYSVSGRRLLRVAESTPAPRLLSSPWAAPARGHGGVRAGAGDTARQGRGVRGPAPRPGDARRCQGWGARGEAGTGARHGHCSARGQGGPARCSGTGWGAATHPPCAPIGREHPRYIPRALGGHLRVAGWHRPLSRGGMCPLTLCRVAEDVALRWLGAGLPGQAQEGRSSLHHAEIQHARTALWGHAGMGMSPHGAQAPRRAPRWVLGGTHGCPGGFRGTHGCAPVPTPTRQGCWRTGR